jgi:hypothetical protein
VKLELDLSPNDWADYKQAPIGDLKRVGVVTPTEPVGIRHFVRLGVLVDGRPAVVMTPWLIWKAAHRALSERLGEAAPEPAAYPPVLDVIEEAMRQHEQRWGLGPEHHDGTSAAWREDADAARHEATKYAVEGGLTWAHVLIEGVYAALAADDPTELTAALARVAGCAANWIEAINGRADG